MHSDGPVVDQDVDMPDFSTTVIEEFGFRKRVRDKHAPTVTSGANRDPLAELVERPDDDDYAPRNKPNTRKKRVYKPKKRKVEVSEPTSDEEPAQDADMEAYFKGDLPRVDDRGNDLFCICRRGDLGKWMIGCDGCDEWYHGDCVNISKDDEDLIDQFYCPRCQKNGDGNTIWKRKCRLQTCRRPASDSPIVDLTRDSQGMALIGHTKHSKASRYCSKEHGIEYFKEKVALALLRPGEIKAMTLHAATIDDFKKIGDVAPMVEGIITNTDRVRLAEMQAERDRLNESLRKLEARVVCLNSMYERALRVNTALKARKEKEICGLDERLSIQDRDLDTLIQSTGFMDTLLGSTTDKLCTVLAKKCNRHAGWYAVKTDSYAKDEETLRGELAKLRSEDEVIRLAAHRRVAA